MTRPTSLRSLRDSMRASFRRAIERGAAARSPTTALSPRLEATLRDWFEPHERALEDFLARLPQATP